MLHCGGGKVTAWLLCFCGESSYQKWEWNVYHDFIFVAAPLAVTDCYVFVFFLFSRCISFGTSQKNKPSGWWNRLLVSLDFWDEMKSLAQVFPKGFSKGFSYKPKTWRLWEFILLYHDEYLILTCQALRLNVLIFPDTEVWYKEICQGWHRSLALQTNWRGTNLRISGSFFWLKLNHSLGRWSRKWGRSWKSSLSKRHFQRLMFFQSYLQSLFFSTSPRAQIFSQVIKQGEPGTSFFVIAQGELEVFIKDAQGEEKRATNSGGKTGKIWKSHEDIGLKDYYERSILLKIWKMPSALFAFPCVNERVGLVGKRFSTWFVLSGSPFQAWNSHPLGPLDGSQITGIWKKWSPKNKTFPCPHTSKRMIQIDERCRFFLQRISWICSIHHVNTWRLALRWKNQAWFMFS